VLLDCASELSTRDGVRADNVAASVARLVEERPEIPHRLRLVERLARYEISTTSPSSPSRRWFPGRIDFTRSVYGAMASWPSEPATTQALLEGLRTGDTGSRLAALQSFTVHARGDGALWRDFSDFLREPPDSIGQALAWLGLWGESGPRTHQREEVDAAWRSGVPEWKVVAARELVRGGHQNEGIRDDLIAAAGRTSLLDHAFHALLASTLVEGWPNDHALIDAMLPDFPHGGVYRAPRRDRGADPEPGLAGFILLSSFLGEPAVEEWCLAELAGKHPFVSLENWAPVLAQSKMSIAVERAAEQYILRATPLGEVKRATLARALKTTAVKEALCRDVRQSDMAAFRAMDALLDVWGRQDETVAELIDERLSAGPESYARFARSIRRLVPDPSERLERLRQCLPITGRWTLPEVLDSIAGEPEASDALVPLCLERLETLDPWTGVPIEFYRRWIHLPEVRRFVLGRTESPDTPWWALADLGKDDIEIRRLVLEALPAIDVGARRLYVESLALRSRAELDTRLKRWTQETDGPARCRAACATITHTGLSAHVGDVEESVRRELSSVGQYVHHRRETAFSLALACGRPEWVLEAVDHQGKPLSLIHQSMSAPNPALWELVAQHWDTLERRLGNDVWARLCVGLSGEPSPLLVVENIAPVVDQYPPVLDRMFSVLDDWHSAMRRGRKWRDSLADGSAERSPGPRSMELVSRNRPHSPLLRDACLLGLRSHTWPTQLTAARLLAGGFANDADVRNHVVEHARRGSSAYRLVVALAWLETESACIRLDEESGRWGILDWAFNAVARDHSRILRFVNSWSTNPMDHGIYQASAVTMVLRSRIRRDPHLADLLVDKMTSSDNVSTLCTIAHVLTGELLPPSAREWAIATMQAERNELGHPGVGFDAGAGRFRLVKDVVGGLVWGMPSN